MHKRKILFLMLMLSVNCELQNTSHYQAIVIAGYSGTPGEIVNGSGAITNLNRPTIDDKAVRWYTSELVLDGWIPLAPN